MRNWRQTELSEYQSSPRLTALLAAIESWLSPDANYEDWYQTVWNIDSASGFGLDFWGRIVNIPRIVSLDSVPTFGFGEAGDRVGFGQGPFFEADIGLTQNYTLDDSVYRQLILAKAAYNITNGSVQAINAILMNLFAGRGNCWVTDGRNSASPTMFFGFGEAGDRVGFGQGSFADVVLTSYIPTFGFGEATDRVGFDQGPFYEAAVTASLPPTLPGNMTLTYTFDFFLEPFEIAIARSGVLPKPTGVLAFWAFLMN